MLKVQAFSGLPCAHLLTVLQAEQAVMLPTFYSEDTPASANETWARLHSDPLFAVSSLHGAIEKTSVASMQTASSPHLEQHGNLSCCSARRMLFHHSSSIVWGVHLWCLTAKQAASADHSTAAADQAAGADSSQSHCCQSSQDGPHQSRGKQRLHAAAGLLTPAEPLPA